MKPSKFLMSAALPVSGAADGALPAGSQPLPPHDQYRHVAYSPPPPLPDYDQPPIPAPGYLWTPGYWDWSDNDGDYYWVPGAWVEPPQAGLFWTPGYWRFYDGRYLFSDGYWGPEVGFYGGVDYGYGYEGDGYYGGRWQGNRFYYNDRVNNFGGRRIDTAYSQDVSRGNNRASYNGGPGGLRVAPSQAAIQAAQARHAPPTRLQAEAVRTARAEPQLRASANRGAPPIAATVRPGVFRGAGVTAASSAGAYTPPANRGPQAGRPAAGPTTPLGTEAPRRGATGAEQGFNRPAEAARSTPAEPQARPTQAYRPERAATQPAYTERRVEARTPEARPAPMRSEPAMRPEPAARPEPAMRQPPAAHVPAAAPRAPEPAPRAAAPQERREPEKH